MFSFGPPPSLPEHKQPVKALQDRLTYVINTLGAAHHSTQAIIQGEGDEATFGRLMTPTLEEARRVLDEMLLRMREHSLAPSPSPPRGAKMRLPTVMPGIFAWSPGIGSLAMPNDIHFNDLANRLSVRDPNDDPVKPHDPPMFLEALGQVYRRVDNEEEEADA